MNDLELIIDLHCPADRQGPGGEVETRRAIELAGLDSSRPLKIADIGCGTGASTLQLAGELNADVVAVDFLAPFLDALNTRAERRGVADRITTLECSMDALPFSDGEFDVIWSEGAIYNIGFEAGVAAWKRFLRPGGTFVVSEITWLTDTRPQDLQDHWTNAYSEIDTASAKIQILERNGYSPAGYFALPKHCWLENYYHPMQAGFEDFMKRNGESDDAKALVEAERQEIALYEKYYEFYSYGLYISQYGSPL